MSNKNPVNIAASVLARLKNLAVQRGWNFMHMLTRYGIERFLFRLGASEYARQFVLKAAPADSRQRESMSLYRLYPAVFHFLGRT